MSQGMRPDGPDNHPLMAVLYELENPWCAADDFFLSVANRRPSSRVVDLGCGTGTLAIAMARDGHRVTGVEPNAAFAAAARSKPGGEDVAWIEGTSSSIATAAFDVAVMSGHVAQAFITDEEWMEVLADLKRALVPGGTLAFDSRDPAARGWEAWTGAGEGELPGYGPFRSRSDIKVIEGDTVTFEVQTILPGGERRWGVSDYRFRSEAGLRQSVEQAGFRIEEVYGGWHGEPVGQGAGEIVVVATA